MGNKKRYFLVFLLIASSLQLFGAAPRPRRSSKNVTKSLQQLTAALEAFYHTDHTGGERTLDRSESLNRYVQQLFAKRAELGGVLREARHKREMKRTTSGDLDDAIANAEGLLSRIQQAEAGSTERSELQNDAALGARVRAVTRAVTRAETQRDLRASGAVGVTDESPTTATWKRSRAVSSGAAALARAVPDEVDADDEDDNDADGAAAPGPTPPPRPPRPDLDRTVSVKDRVAALNAQERARQQEAAPTPQAPEPRYISTGQALRLAREARTQMGRQS